MRVFPLARRGFVVAAALALVSTTSAHADKPTVGQLQVQLVQSRQELNDLYAQSAAASERLNGATYELQVAQKAVKQSRAALGKAKRRLSAQKETVAAMTVEQLQSGSSVARLAALFHSNGAQQMLERATAYSATNEAMAARIDALTARKVVYRAAAREAQDALADQRASTAARLAAQNAINAAIAKARTRAGAVAKERRVLLIQLASAQGSTVDAVTRTQKSIDEQLDRSGPDKPSRGPTAPTTAPTQQPPPPPADPPLPSDSKVETAIAFAKAQLGEPYEWGGAGPSSWDCSGLTMRAWQAAGVYLPHYAGAQYAQTRSVPISKIRRGDLLYWSDGGPGSIYHEALYLGSGQMIHAPRPGRSVEIVALSYWIKPDLASRAG